jgi:hypothetical protein
MLLRQYKNKVHDKMLLSIILAGALYINRDDQAQSFYSYAVAQLQTKPANACSLSTVQSLCLLYWYEFTAYAFRRGTCLVGCCCQMVTKLARSPTVHTSRIGGIDSGQVEKELLRNIYWTTKLFVVWAFIEFDRPLPAELLPSQAEMGFPPESEEESVVYKLDLVSGNTFQGQAKMLGDIWSMSELTSTVERIYSLFTNANKLTATSSCLGPHQAPGAARDMAAMCVKVKEILSMSAERLVGPESYVSSETRAVVIINYHAIIINLLFPRLGTQPPPDVLDTLAASAKALIIVAYSKHSYISGSPIHLANASHNPFTANSLVLGIDACGRAFKATSELGILLPRRGEFIDLARKLLAVLKLDRMAIARRTREAKKALKAVIAGLEGDLLVSPPDQVEYGLLASGGINSSGQSDGQQYVGAGGGLSEAAYLAFEDSLPLSLISPGEMVCQQEQEHEAATAGDPSLCPLPVTHHQLVPGMPLSGYPVHFASEEPLEIPGQNDELDLRGY